jgi:polysaccharide biosynthesis protein PelF
MSRPATRGRAAAASPRTRPADGVDVCFILEGTYPYVSGGVSSWVHDLVTGLDDLRFHIVALLPKRERREFKYKMPPNVVGLSHVYLQELPRGWPVVPGMGRLMRAVGRHLLNLQRRSGLADIAGLVSALAPHRRRLGQRILLDSTPAWNMTLDLYRRTQSRSPFLEFFWTWRALYGGLYATLLADLPKAGAYHAVSTGYAGTMAARAAVETRRPAILTEHGIYTNERRIEIALADWIYDTPYASLSVDDVPRNLKDMWRDTFASYSLACYEACRHILTIFGGNQRFQRADGAMPEKMRVIPNGVDVARFAAIPRQAGPRRPTIALIGRVVPIKDVKTFIRAAGLLQQQVVDLQALILGPFDEDEEYAEECQELVREAGLGHVVEFTGRVNIADFLGRIDIVVLTSISEGQPLVLLEAGAAGVPSVATDVGACREIIEGRPDEQPALGPGGVVTALTSPKATAEACARLLSDRAFYRQCSDAMRARVHRHYNKTDLIAAYRDLYRAAMAAPDEAPIAAPARREEPDGQRPAGAAAAGRGEGPWPASASR